MRVDEGLRGDGTDATPDMRHHRADGEEPRRHRQCRCGLFAHHGRTIDQVIPHIHLPIGKAIATAERLAPE